MFPSRSENLQLISSAFFRRCTTLHFTRVIAFFHIYEIRIEYPKECKNSTLHKRSVNLKINFSWNSIAQKTNEMIDKILPY